MGEEDVLHFWGEIWNTKTRNTRKRDHPFVYFLDFVLSCSDFPASLQCFGFARGKFFNPATFPSSSLVYVTA